MESTEDIIYYQSSYYDEVFGKLNDFPVPTSQTKSREKIKEFKERVNKLLELSKRDSWPHQGRLTITVEIKGSKTYINRIDIDNVLKLLFDIFKKKVFEDDKQIFSIMASKHIVEDNEGTEIHGFLVGLRILVAEERNYCIPDLFSLSSENMIENEVTKLWKAIEIK
ncbi:RusA family crossover junction endodeoxyribonuclease [Flavobacterium tructae]|uniref:RusA family crossover junction endodeoxyribonuclease n=1 Tax=Flavobacterium tructae TaxID=1114873 RepID=UPI002551CB11|nr:RusA family crossover junction endodeoxyribonuclease [Flavobacterium tructae]MDL2141784.1 RusA family crossover junction endodeoxyribonuclease [Flavobacterium tructae]